MPYRCDIFTKKNLLEILEQFLMNHPQNCSINAYRWFFTTSGEFRIERDALYHPQEQFSVVRLVYL